MPGPEVRGLARELKNPPEGLALRWAVVQSLQAGPPASLTLRMGGDATDVPGVRYLAAYSPTAGDTVAVLLAAGDLLVLGRLA